MSKRDKSLRLPVGSLIFVGLAVGFMVVWSVIQWPDMAATVVTGEARGNRGESTASREFTAVALPAVLALLAVLLSVLPDLDQRVMTRIFGPQRDRDRGSPRVLGAFLVGLSILFGTLHVAFVGMHTGADLPIEQMAAVAAGVVLTVLGIYLPLARPSTTLQNERLEAFRAAQGPAYRVGGFALTLVGVATVVSGLLMPQLSLVISTAGIAITFAGIILYSLVRASRA